MSIPNYDLKVCENLAKELNVSFKDIIAELDNVISDCDISFVFYCLANKFNIDASTIGIDCSLETCKEKAKGLPIAFKDIIDSLENSLSNYDIRFILYFLANYVGVDFAPNEVDCTYTSVWDGEGSITSNARVNLNTRKVTIFEDSDYWDILTEDGEPFECNQLENEYVTIDGIDYPCHNINDDGIWDDVDCWTKETSYYYE